MIGKCPYCNGDLEPGYIQCRDGVAWTRKKSPVAALSTLSALGGSAIVLASGGGAFSGAAVEAGCCPACQKIIIDYSDAG